MGVDPMFEPIGRTKASPLDAEEWCPTLRPPSGPEPDFRHPKLGEPSGIWKYRNSVGLLEGYICRFETTDADGRPGKEFRPCRYGTLIKNGEQTALWPLRAFKPAQSAPNHRRGREEGGCRSTAISDTRCRLPHEWGEVSTQNRLDASCWARCHHLARSRRTGCCLQGESGEAGHRLRRFFGCRCQDPGGVAGQMGSSGHAARWRQSRDPGRYARNGRALDFV
jgi:hypothetical protein